MNEEFLTQIADLQQQINELKGQMPKPKKTPFEIGVEEFELSKKKQQERVNTLSYFAEQVRTGKMSVEQVFNIKPKYGLIVSNSEFDWITPPGLQRNGSGVYKVCRKLYIENPMFAACIGFYDKEFKKPRKLLHYLGLLSNPLTGKENANKQNELAAARQLFSTEYEIFLNNLPELPEPVEVPDFLDLLNEFEHSKIKVTQYVPD